MRFSKRKTVIFESIFPGCSTKQAEKMFGSPRQIGAGL